MKLIAFDLLKEELEISISLNHRAERIELLKDAIRELDDLMLRLDCENCKYHITLEELKKLSDEDSLEMFNKCSNCSNYSDSLFESKQRK